MHSRSTAFIIWLLKRRCERFVFSRETMTSEFCFLFNVDNREKRCAFGFLYIEIGLRVGMMMTTWKA